MDALQPDGPDGGPECPSCGQEFDSPDQLREHMQEEHM